MQKHRPWSILVVPLLLLPACSGESSAPGQTCSYNGRTYPDRTSWFAPDGCNECTCLAGNAGCSAVACDAATGSNPPCTYAGTSYPFGVTFPSADGCNVCECSWRWYHDVNPGPAEVACTFNRCVGASPPDAGVLSGTPAEGCVYDRTTYPADVRFPSTDGCDECHCRSDGQVTCTLRHLGCPGKLAVTDASDGALPSNEGALDGATEAVSTDAAPVYCSLDDGRRIPAGAAFADGCNCCVCTSSGQSACQGAACPGDGGSSPPVSCQSDRDCLAQGYSTCVFDPGCDSPRGTCLRGAGVCPLSAVSDLGTLPSHYCGCDGVTFDLTYAVTYPHEYPYQPYRHVGPCVAADLAASPDASQAAVPDAL